MVKKTKKRKRRESGLLRPVDKILPKLNLEEIVDISYLTKSKKFCKLCETGWIIDKTTGRQMSHHPTFLKAVARDGMGYQVITPRRSFTNSKMVLYRITKKMTKNFKGIITRGAYYHILLLTSDLNDIVGKGTIVKKEYIRSFLTFVEYTDSVVSASLFSGDYTMDRTTENIIKSDSFKWSIDQLKKTDSFKKVPQGFIAIAKESKESVVLFEKGDLLLLSLNSSDRSEYDASFSYKGYIYDTFIPKDNLENSMETYFFHPNVFYSNYEYNRRMTEEENYPELMERLKIGYKSNNEKIIDLIFSGVSFHPDYQVLANEDRQYSEIKPEDIKLELPKPNKEKVKRPIRKTERALIGRENVEIIYPSGRSYRGRIRFTTTGYAVIEPSKGNTAAWLCDSSLVKDMDVIDLSNVPHQRVYHSPAGIKLLKEMKYINVYDS